MCPEVIAGQTALHCAVQAGRNNILQAFVHGPITQRLDGPAVY
ncbi:hypothetical protein [Paenibacillus oceani]